jgi:hypothetical protein
LVTRAAHCTYVGLHRTIKTPCNAVIGKLTSQKRWKKAVTGKDTSINAMLEAQEGAPDGLVKPG